MLTYTTIATFSSSINFEEILNIFVKLCKAGTLIASNKDKESGIIAVNAHSPLLSNDVKDG